MSNTRSGEKFRVEDITININTVNRPGYLESCIDSLKKTTPEGVPLQIVFNGTPADIRQPALDRAEGWNGPTNFVILDEILPIADSHNRALETIETPLVNFMGDDDVVLGNRLPLIIDAFNSNEPTPVCVTSYARRIAGDAFEPGIGSLKAMGPTTIAEWRRWHRSGEPFEMLWPGSVLDTEALRSIGGFSTEFANIFDVQVFSNLSFVGPVLSITDEQFGFRIHSGSNSTTNWGNQRQLLRYFRVCHEAQLDGIEPPTMDAFQQSEAEQPRWQQIRRNRYENAQLMFRLGGEHWVSGKKLDGAKYFAKSILSSPAAFITKVGDQR
jgi:hypothetical protein